MGAGPQDLSGHVIVEGSLLGAQWRPLTQGVSPRAVLPPKRHRAVSGDICGCHDQGVPGMGGRGLGARDAARTPERPGRPLQERPTPGDTARGVGASFSPNPFPNLTVQEATVARPAKVSGCLVCVPAALPGLPASTAGDAVWQEGCGQRWPRTFWKVGSSEECAQPAAGVEVCAPGRKPQVRGGTRPPSVGRGLRVNRGQRKL